MITLQDEVAQKAVATDNTDKHIADIAEQLRRRRERRLISEPEAQGRGIQSADGAKSATMQQPAQQPQGAQTKRPSFAVGAPSVSGAAMADADQTSGQAKEEPRDLAWFGGKHTDCNTILYKAPLQGWNTLLPSSFAHKAATPARKR